jgi:hypothetical protein
MDEIGQADRASEDFHMPGLDKDTPPALGCQLGSKKAGPVVVLKTQVEPFNEIRAVIPKQG